MILFSTTRTGPFVIWSPIRIAGCRGAVLISPIVVDQGDWEGKGLPVLLTQEQVKTVPISVWTKLSRREMKSSTTTTKRQSEYGEPL